MISRILFGTDFRDESSRAEAYARELARRLSASVVVLHAIEPLATVGDEPPDQEFYEDLRRESEQHLDAVRSRFAAEGIGVRSVVSVGPRWREIIDTARREQADLIVLGARRFADRPVGTTSHQVFLASPIPVCVVRAPEPETE